MSTMMTAKTKPGWKTTEFWMTIAANLAAIIGAFADMLPPEKAVLLIAASNGLYAIARGQTKRQ
jgi:hypothetical protein